MPLIPTKPGALGQLLNSAPELLERVSALTARLTELLCDRNQNSIAAILENVQVISRNLAERSDEIAATLAEARVAIRQTGDRGPGDGPARRHRRQDPRRRRPADARRSPADRSAPPRPAWAISMPLIGDARPGLQAFSKQTIPEVGQLVRDLREMSDALSAVAQRLNTAGRGRDHRRLEAARLQAEEKMRQIRPFLAPAVALAAALAVSGCLSFGPKVPPTLMRLTSDAQLTASSRTAPAGEAITVVPPTAPAELLTPRVPVRTGATQVAYVKDAQWVEVPTILFARLVSETIAAKTGRVVLDPKQFTFDPGPAPDRDAPDVRPRGRSDGGGAGL